MALHTRLGIVSQVPLGLSLGLNKRPLLKPSGTVELVGLKVKEWFDVGVPKPLSAHSVCN